MVPLHRFGIVDPKQLIRTTGRHLDLDQPVDTGVLTPPKDRDGLAPPGDKLIRIKSRRLNVF
jgi:hypothetical protein